MTTTSHATTDPAIHRYHLGQQLRALRETRALKLQDAADTLGITPSTLSRIETGKAVARTSCLTTLLNLYNVTDPRHRAHLTSLASQGRRANPQHDTTRLLPATAIRHLGLEDAAAHIDSYSPHAIPDLLQTPDYAAAATHAAQPDLTAGQIAQLVAITGRRQHILRDPNRSFRFILDESALRRAIAPPPVMTSQLDHLATLAETPNITIQAATLTPAPPVLSPAFDLLTIPGHPDHHIGIRHPHDITTRTADLRNLHRTLTTLTRTALTPQDTRDLITAITDP
jgi:transcriptional regulator with XRE-family HTH domain